MAGGAAGGCRLDRAPAEAIRPDDRLADLWRMQWLGPNLLDVVFRLEWLLRVKIPNVALKRHVADKYSGQGSQFQDFAEAMVDVLRGLLHRGAKRWRNQ